jgi:hypothetical protein
MRGVCLNLKLKAIACSTFTDRNPYSEAEYSGDRSKNLQNMLHVYDWAYSNTALGLKTTAASKTEIRKK